MVDRGGRVGGVQHRGSQPGLVELTHDGIDHVLIGASLKARLAPSALTMRAVNYVDADGAPLRANPGAALPSDHCAHVVTWEARRGPAP